MCTYTQLTATRFINTPYRYNTGIYTLVAQTRFTIAIYRVLTSCLDIFTTISENEQNTGNYIRTVSFCLQIWQRATRTRKWLYGGGGVCDSVHLPCTPMYTLTTIERDIAAAM